MTTRKKDYTFRKFLKQSGAITFANSLEDIILTDFEGNKSACARALEITPQTLNSYLMGKRIPSPGLAAEMAKVLGYLPEAFMELALTDSVRNAGFNFTVLLETA